MLNKNNYILILCLAAFQSFAQQVYIGDYRSSQNPNYWKNKMPDAAYWQQDVQYKINATIHEKQYYISADESLEYWNNSPDTLYEIYFHLYQNAFAKGSYLSKLHVENKIKPKYSHYTNQGLGTVLEDIKVDGQEVQSKLDNTILKIKLNTPLLPNNSLTFTTKFKTYFGSGTIRRRMAMYNAWGWWHFNGVHWYPRISVYDRRKGWDLDQHLNKELYGDYGTFEVNLNFANNYIVEATGKLMNEEEVLPQELKSKLQITNFKNTNWSKSPSTVIPYDSSIRKIWKYRAVNVHDFAFTADPSYRIAEQYINGVQCVAICQEPHCSKWLNAADYTTKIIGTFSRDFGSYIYPKMVVADANDGMEYPMITLDGGGEPGYRGLFVHEIGHNWFYGMVGNNETYRAALDEGFTQYLTEWGLKKIDGDTMVEDPIKSKYVRKFHKPADVSFRNVYGRYLYEALAGEKPDFNKHSNDYHGALGHENGYGEVYYKTAVMLNNLRYTLGDSLFSKAMKHYVNSWKIAHPYFSDFRQAIHDATKLDLDWFFDQWIEQYDRTINYKIVKCKQKNDTLFVNLKRNGTMIMPIDLSVITKNGDTAFQTISNMYFNKVNEITPRWFAFDGMNDRYTAKIPLKSEWKSILIDSKNYLADLNMTNNTKCKSILSKDKYNFTLNGLIYNAPDRRKYELSWRPDIWWNNIDGLKIGVNLSGGHLGLIHNFELNSWYASGIGSDPNLSVDRNKFQYNFLYNTIFTQAPRLSLNIHSALLEGLSDNSIKVSYRTQSKWNLSGIYRTFTRNTFAPYLYLDHWTSTTIPNLLKLRNSFLEVASDKSFQHFNGTSQLKISARSSFNIHTKNYIASYQKINIEYKRAFSKGKFEFRNRLFGQLGGGQFPSESELFMASGNMEDAMNDKLTRSIGILQMENKFFNSQNLVALHTNGGLNLRGYNGIINNEFSNGNSYNYYAGMSGMSYNAEIDFDQYIKFKPKLFRNWLHMDSYIFTDLGIISDDTYLKVSPLFVDAGLGFAFTIKKWWNFNQVKPLTLKIDLPLFVNSPTASNPNYFMLRYLIGVNRTF